MCCLGDDFAGDQHELHLDERHLDEGDSFFAMAVTLRKVIENIISHDFGPVFHCVNSCGQGGGRGESGIGNPEPFASAVEETIWLRVSDNSASAV